MSMEGPRPTRREVLGLATAAALEASIPFPALASKKERVAAAEQAPHPKISESPVSDWHELVPEADRELKIGFISIGKSPEHVEDYGQIIAQMHPQAKIFAIVHKDARSFAETLKSETERSGRNIFLAYTTSQQDDYWGRDFGISILKGPEKSPVFITSSSRSWDGEPMPYADERKSQLNALRSMLLRQAGIETVEAPFPFEGGNISFGGDGRVFVGHDMIFTRISDDAEAELTPAERAERSAFEAARIVDRIQRVKSFFKAKEVIVLGRERQSDLYHTDLSSLILPGNKAMLTWFPENYVGSAPDEQRRTLRETVKRQQEEARKRLIDAKFEVRLLEHSAEELDASNIAINAIPFVRYGKRHVLIPIYRSQRKDADRVLTMRTPLTRADILDSSSAVKAADMFDRLGYTPIFVGSSGIGFSGPHCVMNQIARDTSQREEPSKAGAGKGPDKAQRRRMFENLGRLFKKLLKQ